MRIFRVFVAAFVAVGAGNIAVAENEDVIIAALNDELERSKNELQLEDSPKPYFVAYTVFDNTQYSESFFLGTSVRDDQSQARTLRVEVRVGSYELDNRNYAPRANRSSAVTQGLPLTDDYEELRRNIWRATDRAYKNAVQNLASKKTALENRRQEDTLADFSIEEPYRHVSGSEADFEAIDLHVVRDPARKLSEVFLNAPEIYTSVVVATAAKRRRVFVNSEGSFHDIYERQCRIRTMAFTQADDGTELQDYSTEYSTDCATFSPLSVMESRVQGMIDRLRNLRVATPPEEVYNGPVMFEGQAASELFRRLLLPRLLAIRVPMTDDPRRDSLRPRNPFLDKIGARVISAKIDVINDPTLAFFEGNPLLGHYEVDRQGVPAERTHLIEGGRLQTLLSTRSPVDDFTSSTGSSRSGGGAIPGNVFLLPEEGEGLADEEMQKEMEFLMQDYGVEYGVVVRRLANRSELAFGNRTSNVLEAYKVFPDGREELLPVIEITGYNDRTLRDIVAVSKGVNQYDTVFGFSGGPWVTPMSIVCPSILIEELTVRKMRPISPKPPVVPHPYTEPSAVSN
ncbi:MAG: metallopeptidase TldD-related protein [Gammaproteobacteria bacterium]|nr:metallopeptidase TldD-related protein [Gammaproteobacteria bacterium]